LFGLASYDKRSVSFKSNFWYENMNSQEIDAVDGERELVVGCENKLIT
jgi:hypothetical protein